MVPSIGRIGLNVMIREIEETNDIKSKEIDVDFTIILLVCFVILIMGLFIHRCYSK